jgi:hypothetical protein
MLSFKQYFLLNEGGAGGHMLHPLNLPEIKTGKDLISLYEKTAHYLALKGAPVKIDGTNVSVRLVDTDHGKEFAIYRGAKIDMEGPPATLSYLSTRFAENPGAIKSYEQVLNIFNKSLPQTTKELKVLGLYNDPNIFFNTEFVAGTSNIIGYNNKFLAIHYPAKITEKFSAKKGTKSYGSEHLSFDAETLNAFVDKVNIVAQEFGFNVIHQSIAKMVGKPDFNAALSSELTINNETKTLKQWLSTATNPSGKVIIKAADGKPTSGVNQGLYLDVIENGIDINTLVASKSLPVAINCIVFWHATRLLGKAILDTLDSNLGKPSQQEGVVINTPSISIDQFKITGDFFVRNAAASPYKKQPTGAVKTAVITYGRFNPPTVGHQALLQTLSQTGTQNKANLTAVFPSHTVNKDNPVPFDLKAQVLQAISPKNVQVLPDGKTLFAVLSYLSKNGYNRVIHIAGSDRLPEYERLIKQYVNKADAHGDITYNIPDYTFVSSGDRDPDAEGVAGMSASKVRAAAKANDYKTFNNGIAQGLPEDLKKQLFNTIKNS